MRSSDRVLGNSIGGDALRCRRTVGGSTVTAYEFGHSIGWNRNTTPRAIVNDPEDRSAAEPADAFGALSDPLRVGILRALAAFYRETGTAGPIGFADLRRRTDVRDSGRFRYHLNRLRGRFVEKADGGYRLTYAGREVVAAVLMGTYTERVTIGPETLDSDCFVCGEPAVATYEDGICRVGCANDHSLFRWDVPPNAAADATMPAIVELAELLVYQGIKRALAGVCPKCYHPIGTEVRLEDEAPQPSFRAECETCGGRVVGPVGFRLLVDPRVAAAYRRHGRGLREFYVWELPFVRESAIASIEDDPVRVEIDVRLDDERLSATIDETGQVTAVDR
jgi:DNA-binding transcriptional ArsR family regulator